MLGVDSELWWWRAGRDPKSNEPLEAAPRAIVRELTFLDFSGALCRSEKPQL